MITKLWIPVLVSAVWFGAASPHALAQATTGDIRVENLRLAFNNGEHNAFTDLVRFQNRIYLTFRTCPDGHMVHPTSHILVLESRDEGRQWNEVHRFSVPLRDVRDPHFLVFQDKLWIQTGTWYCGESSPKSYDMNEQLGYAVCSTNGKDWSEPGMLNGTYGHYIWRGAVHENRAYLCGRRKKDFVKVASRTERDPLVQSVLLESEDGWNWRHRSMFQESFGDETAFVIEPDGVLTAICRSPGNRPAIVARSRAPYEEWERSPLDRYIGGPLLVQWEGRWLVGGRNITKEGPRTTLSWLVGDQLKTFLTLPSAGDNSYPGFVPLGPGRALVSWYSSHDKDESGKTGTSIYLAELILQP